jgi:hypothetical protein
MCSTIPCVCLVCNSTLQISIIVWIKSSMKYKFSSILQECLMKTFACKIRISSPINLTIQFFIRTLTFFFPMYPYTHGGNTLLIDENMFNEPYNAIFWSIFDCLHGKDHYLLGIIFSYLEFLYFLNMVFPRLYITILLVGLDVLIVMILDKF